MVLVKVIWDAISSILLGIGLPCGDIGTDINLGVRLFLSGNPRWATWVLAPVFMNVIFTVFACKKIEKHNWWKYIPLILLQCYPQFCVVRLLMKWAQSKINHPEFVEEMDILNGGVGCVESYLESVPQAYIQTAFFVVANNLTNVVTRLCYNEIAHSCGQYENKLQPNCSIFQNCSSFVPDNCKPVSYFPYRYRSNEQIAYCEENNARKAREASNCTAMFQDCIEPLYVCLRGCQDNLTNKISKLGDKEVLESSFLMYEYDASVTDMKNIQLYLLFIGDTSIFLSTYALSIFAAAYGVSKFFRLSYFRHCDVFRSNWKGEYVNEGISYVTFGATFLITGMFLVGKGLALAAFMSLDENEMIVNVSLWLAFCMLPSFLFAMAVIVCNTFYESHGKTCFGWTWYRNYSLDIISKCPPILIAPIVTPFVYLPNQFKYVTVKREIENQPGIKYFRHLSFFEIDYRLSYINTFLTIIVACLGVVFKAQVQKTEMILLLTLIFSMAITFLLYVVQKRDGGNSKRCFLHAKLKSECIECSEKFGLCYDERKATKEVKEHGKIKYIIAYNNFFCVFYIIKYKKRNIYILNLLLNLLLRTKWESKRTRYYKYQISYGRRSYGW